MADGVYLNPAIPEAAAYVVDGVAELVSRYAVDGVHFDDYFYPTTDPSIDAAQFAASGAQDLEAWRRAERHRPWSRRPTTPSRPRTLPCGLGSAPRATPTTTSTSSTATYTAGWRPRVRTPWWITCAPSSTGGMGIPCPAARSALPIPISWPSGWPCPGALRPFYIGLGAYRIGDGDGGANPDSTAQWSTGQALARQVAELRAQGAGGYALYRYGSLFANSAWPQLAQAECQALQTANSAAEVV